MTLPEFFGCALLAFGPPLALFAFTIAKEPLKVIIFIAGAFFWLVSLLLSSILWFAVVPLRNKLAFGLVFSVFIQELFRFAYYKLLQKAEGGLQKFTDVGSRGTSVIQLAQSRHVIAYVAGLGFGFMSGAFALVNVLADVSGPGTVGIHGDSDLFLIISAVTTLMFIMLHVCWSVVLHYACWQTTPIVRYGGIATVVATHLFVSSMTLLNKDENYAITTIAVGIVLVVMSAVALSASGMTRGTVKAAIFGGRDRTLHVPAD